MIHLIDGFEETGKPWQMACTPKPGCDFISDRISVTVLHSNKLAGGIGLADAVGTVVQSLSVPGGGGIIVRPSLEATRVLCGYGGDGGSRKMTCNPPGTDNPRCIPGCIRCYPKFCQTWCDPRKHTIAPHGWCEGKPWRPGDLGKMLDSNVHSAEYNEVVLDGFFTNQHLPGAIEAMFYLPTDLNNGAAAKAMHNAFLEAYPSLKYTDVPLLRLDDSGPKGSGPFVLVPETPEVALSPISMQGTRSSWGESQTGHTGSISDLGYGRVRKVGAEQ